jgi:hypothetical protein
VDSPPRPSLTGFAARLRDLRRRAGEPSLRELERLTRRTGRPYPRATIDDKLHGRTLPDWEFVATFVDVCHRHAGWPGLPDLDGWRAEHRRVLAELAGQRAGQRRVTGAAEALAGAGDPLAVTVKLADVSYLLVRGPDGVHEVPAAGHRVRLIVEAPQPPAVVLTDLRPVVLGRRPAAGDLVPHHGVVPVRPFAAHLDEEPPRLERLGDSDFPFKVTPDDPEVLDLTVHTATADVRWVLELDWTCAGRSGTRRVDLGGQPFRTMAQPG